MRGEGKNLSGEKKSMCTENKEARKGKLGEGEMN